MSTHQIHVFISHSWAYSGHYETLSTWIFSERWAFGQALLDFRNFSIPRNDPIHNVGSTAQLQSAIFNKIARSHVVVIPSGMYTNYSKWIQKEIDGAKSYQKPIVAVNPWGQERRAGVVLNNADIGVGWNKKPIVEAIWQVYYENNR